MKLNGNSHGLTRLLLILAAALLLLIGTASLAEEGRNPSSRSGESAPQKAPGGVEDDSVSEDRQAPVDDEVVDEEVADEEAAPGDETVGEEPLDESAAGESGAGTEGSGEETEGAAETAPEDLPVPAMPGIAEPEDDPNAPTMPSMEQIRESRRGQIEGYIPVDYKFRIGLICDFREELEVKDAEGNPTFEKKSPFLLIDPRTGGYRVGKDNFPARVIANSEDGKWVVAIAPSSTVEGTSGAANKEAAISLNLPSGQVRLIQEFPLHSNFQAYFAAGSSSRIYYCVNEPGVENRIISYTLENKKEEIIPAEGNRFQIYGVRSGKQKGIWVQDPLTLASYPVASLLDLKGKQLDRVEFPGTAELYAQPSGQALLATVMDRAEASLGYYKTEDRSFHQIPDLVLTRPVLKWARKSNAVVAKESAVTQDRFVWIDLDTNTATEILTVKYKVKFWDISPQDDALVLVADSIKDPVLTVVPLGPEAATKPVNTIKLKGISNLQWVGCLYAFNTGGGSWFEKFFPKGIF
ncbi:hypothetical protein IT575_04455 [bacterium]|nr:hypothetical protein [bacterium]